MVLATIKLRINIGGREQSTDQATQANATILDSTGLDGAVAVVAPAR